MEPSFFSAEHVHVLLNHPAGDRPGDRAPRADRRLGRAKPPGANYLVRSDLLAAFSTWPVNVTGQRSYRIIRGMADDAGVTWLDDHMDRAEKLAPAFYGLAGLAVVAAVAPRKWPCSTMPLALATLVVALGCAGASGWIALAGGHIRHPEFRTSELPADQPMETHRHDEK